MHKIAFLDEKYQIQMEKVHKYVTSNVLSHAYGLSRAATHMRATSSLDIFPCIHSRYDLKYIISEMLIENIHGMTLSTY